MGEHQYRMPDLRHLVAGRRAHFQETTEATAEPFFLQTRNVLAVPQQTHYDSSMVGHEAMLRSGLVKLGHDHYCSSNATTLPGTSNIASGTIASSSSGAAATLCGVEMEREWAVNLGGNNNSRWPRQETLTLLEIRSRLDSRFKEANQKGPLWDEVSRIMGEEHGYQRSGKKCREKFENLYKYYRKTREGKAGRQDGKHYRFFRQLEALYGEASSQTSGTVETTRLVSNISLFQNPTGSTANQEYKEAFQENKHSCESISFSNASEFETSSSENNDDDLSAIAHMMNRSSEKHKKANESYCHAKTKKSWKTKVKEFVDLEMRKVVEGQQVWMEKMLRTIEDREQAIISREQEWTKQEMARFDREHKFWAKEREWIRARDASLMEALKKYTGKGQELSTTIEQIALATQCHYENQQSSAKKIQNNVFTSNMWTEPEILTLLQIRNAMEQRFQESGYSKGGLWEEIAEKMASSGYDRSVDDCKEKWESFRRRHHPQQLECHDSQDIATEETNCMTSTSTSFVGSQVQGGRFQRPTNDGGEHLWYKYGLSSG